MNDPGPAGPIERLDVDAAELIREHPPAWRNANKRVIREVAGPPGAEHGGRIGNSRWEAMPLPVDVSPVPADLVVARSGFYRGYVPIQQASAFGRLTRESGISFRDAYRLLLRRGFRPRLDDPATPRIIMRRSSAALWWEESGGTDCLEPYDQVA